MYSEQQARQILRDNRIERGFDARTCLEIVFEGDLAPKVEVPETVARQLGSRALLSGEEAKLAQFQNLTANVRQPKAPYFVR